MRSCVIIVVHNYIVVTLYILVRMRNLNAPQVNFCLGRDH